MFDSDDISEMLPFITNNYKKNLEEMRLILVNDLHNVDNYGNTLLHAFAYDSCYDEEPKRLLAIQTLLDYGLNPNDEDITGQNFIQAAMYDGTTDQYILQLIDEAIKYKLDVNHKDSSGNTMMHSAIFSNNYDVDTLISIHNLLEKHGFNKDLLNKQGMDTVKAMYCCEAYGNDEIKYFKEAIGYDKESHINKKDSITRTEIEEDFKNFGQVLNNKQYKFKPTIGRDKEIMEIMISLAKEKESTIIVGESGVGKSALLDELAYQIQNNNVPKFLKHRTIVEVMPSSLVSGCEYVGQFEKKMHEFLKLCEKHNAIVVINEIHSIYGTGVSKGNDNDMASILKTYLDKPNFKIIGTTTNDEYEKYFTHNALKRRFGKILVKEPDKETLKVIICKVINDYLENNNISFQNEKIKKDIIDNIIWATEDRHRVYNDKENNPSLAISIIDTAFAISKVYDSETIDLNHFIQAIESNYRIYDIAKKEAIDRLKYIKMSNEIPKKLSKIISLKKDTKL